MEDEALGINYNYVVDRLISIQKDACGKDKETALHKELDDLIGYVSSSQRCYIENILKRIGVMSIAGVNIDLNNKKEREKMKAEEADGR